MGERPNEIPLEDWPLGWLRMECTSIFERETGDVVDAFYRASNMPRREMLKVIRKDRESLHG